MLLQIQFKRGLLAPPIYMIPRRRLTSLMSSSGLTGNCQGDCPKSTRSVGARHFSIPTTIGINPRPKVLIKHESHMETTLAPDTRSWTAFVKECPQPPLGLAWEYFMSGKAVLGPIVCSHVAAVMGCVQQMRRAHHEKACQEPCNWTLVRVAAFNRERRRMLLALAPKPSICAPNRTLNIFLIDLR